MSKITINCIDQNLQFENTPDIYSGDVNTDYVTFYFCNVWSGYTKTAIFYRTEKEVYEVLLDQHNTCVIPKEVLTKPGALYLGVFGVSGDKVLTSQVLRFNVKMGAITEDLNIPDPTPEIYQQFISDYDRATKEMKTYQETLTETTNAFIETQTKEFNDFEEALTQKCDRLADGIVSLKDSTLAYSYEGKANIVMIAGAVEQGENQSLENPQEIANSLVSEIKTHGKNFIPYPYREMSHTENGVTFTVYEDGSVRIKGTPTATANLRMCWGSGKLSLPVGNYIMSGCKSTDFRVIADWYDSTDTVLTSAGNTTTKPQFEVTEDNVTNGHTLGVSLRVYANGNEIDAVVYPMISVEGGEYEPYKSTTAKVAFTGRAIEVTADDDYTYEKDGKYYIADTIEKIDGEYKKVQRIGKSNGQDLSWTLSTTYIGSVYTKDLVGVIECKVPVLCSHVEWITYSLTNYAYGKTIVSSSGVVNFYLKNEAFADENEVKTWLLENDFYFQYALLEPIITPLSATEQLALNSLSTYDTVTHILTDSIVKPFIVVEYGTSRNGAVALESYNESDINSLRKSDKELFGKSAIFFGDSITWGEKADEDGVQVDEPYPTVFGNITGATIINVGVRGATASTAKTNNFNAQIVANETNVAEADYCFINFGVNDFSKSIQVGNESTSQSFYADYLAGIESILTLNSKIEIIVILPPRGKGYTIKNKWTNDNGEIIDNYVNAIIDIATKKRLRIVDFGNVGIGEDNASIYYPNGNNHLIQEGYTLFGEHLAKTYKTGTYENIETFYNRNYRVATNFLDPMVFANPKETANDHYTGVYWELSGSNTQGITSLKSYEIMKGERYRFAFKVYHRERANNRTVSYTITLQNVSTSEKYTYQKTVTGVYEQIVFDFYADLSNGQYTINIVASGDDVYISGLSLSFGGIIPPVRKQRVGQVSFTSTNTMTVLKNKFVNGEFIFNVRVTADVAPTNLLRATLNTDDPGNIAPYLPTEDQYFVGIDLTDNKVVPMKWIYDSEETVAGSYLLRVEGGVETNHEYVANGILYFGRDDAVHEIVTQEY